MRLIPLLGFLLILGYFASASSVVMNQTALCPNSPSIDVDPTLDVAYLKAPAGSEALTDHDLSTKVSYSGGSQYSATIDLGGLNMKLNYLNFTVASPNGNRMQRIYVQYSSDNAAWNTLYEATVPGAAATATYALYLYPKDTRYIRVHMYSAAGCGGTCYLDIYDLKAYQKPDTCNIYKPKYSVANNNSKVLFYYFKSTLATGTFSNEGLWAGSPINKDIAFGTTHVDTENAVDYAAGSSALVPASGTLDDFVYDVFERRIGNYYYFIYTYLTGTKLNNGFTAVVQKVDNAGSVSTLGSVALVGGVTQYQKYGSNAIASDERLPDPRIFFAAGQGTGQNYLATGSMNSTAVTSTLATTANNKYLSAAYNSTSDDFYAVYQASSTTLTINHISATGASLATSTFKTSANPNSNAIILAGGTRGIYSSSDPGNLEVTSRNVIPALDYSLTSNSISDSVVSAYVPLLGQGTAVTVWRNASTVFLIDYFNLYSTSPVFGISGCSSGYIFDGFQCVYLPSGGYGLNQTFDRVELYTRDYCRNNYGSFFHGSVPSCPNSAAPFTDTRDFIQLRYYINAQDAYNITNGTAYCKGYDLSNNEFDFTYKQFNDGGYGFEKDVSYDLGNEDSGTFCNGFNVFTDTYCLRNNFIVVKCYANNALYTGDDISDIFFVRGSSQKFTSWNYQVGTGGSVPTNAQKIDYQLSYNVNNKNGDLDCRFASDAIDYSRFAELLQMTGNVQSTGAVWAYTENSPVSVIGDNRFTLKCSQYNGNDPVETKIEYDKYNAFDSCNNATNYAYMKNVRFVGITGYALNYSANNTQITSQDRFIEIQGTYSYIDSGGSHDLADATTSCVMTLYNATNMAIINANVPMSANNGYYAGSIGGPNVDSTWSVPVGDVGNYTIGISCISSQCKGNANTLLNFSVKSNPCAGVDDACYPTNKTDPNSACYSCYSNTTQYTCEDGVVMGQAFGCYYNECRALTNGCTACMGLSPETSHMNINLKTKLNKHLTTALSPNLQYEIRLYNRTSEINLLSNNLNSVCSVFLVNNGGPGLSNCEPYSAGVSLPGYSTDLCGYEYQTIYDASLNAFVWKSDDALSLTPQTNFNLYASCTGDYGTSDCSQRFSKDQFTTGGVGKCPNSAVNISGGGFTDDGQCFENAKPFICDTKLQQPVHEDSASCGCPNGMTINTTTNGCNGTRQYGTSDVSAQLTVENVVFGGIVLFIVVLLGLLAAKWRGSGNKGRIIDDNL
jgi:hypothetical protein